MSGGPLGPDPIHSLIAPMKPVAVPAPPDGGMRGFPWDDREYAYQLKWDGIRMLAFVERGRVRLQNRRLRDRTAVYPEMAALGDRIRAREAILDGEVVVLGEGRPSFPRVLKRELAAGTRAVDRLSAELPAAFAVFDLLYLDGSDLAGRPWWARQEMLAARLEPGGVAHLTGSTGDGPALWAAVVSEGLEGVVAKRRVSPYLPGGRSRHWLKIKLRRRLDGVVGGYTRTPEGVGALLVGLYGGGAAGPGLVYVGRVGTGLTDELRHTLAERLRGLETPRPHFVNPPRLAGLDVRWTAPLITVTVTFAEWTEDLKLRAPALAGFSRTDPEQCRLD